MTIKTKSQIAAQDVSALLRARNPLLWIVTREESRVERYIAEAAGLAGYAPVTWDVSQGVLDMAGNEQRLGGVEPNQLLDAIRDESRSKEGTRRAWIMRDLNSWLAGQQNATTVRQLRNLARSLPGTVRNSAQAMIVLTTSSDVPPDLASIATVIEWPIPDRNEIAAILDDLAKVYSLDLNGTRDAAIDAAVGLTSDEAASCYAKSLVQLKRIDPATVASEKKRVISREKVLEFFDPLSGGLESIGGLENLKVYLRSRAMAYSPEARAYGLPSPKGIFLAGIPGCGKSLTAKAISTAFSCPLVRLDMGALKSKFVGESEQNLRRAFKSIEAMGKVVVWIDEIEKAMQGATSGSADGGVSSDALGTLLSFMQERSGQSYFVATANDIESLPPELLRAGRFDSVYFVDLPTSKERASILTTALRAHNRSGVGESFPAVIEATAGFTGSEIASLVPDAMYRAFADNAREITAEDLVAAAKAIVPLSKTAADKIEKLRTWAKGKARNASAPEEGETSATTNSRQLDM